MKVILDLTQEQVNRLSALLYTGASYVRHNHKRSEDWWEITDSALDAWDAQTPDITGIDE